MSADLAGRRIRAHPSGAANSSSSNWMADTSAGASGHDRQTAAGWQPGRHTHAVVNLDRGVLRYEDQRQFGKIEAGNGLPARVEKLGPEPLEVTLAEFARTAQEAARRASNPCCSINGSCAAWVTSMPMKRSSARAFIRWRSARSCAPERVKRLHSAIVEVLTQAIEKGGSSISDYVDADGRSGFFQFEHRVYQRTGEPCMNCGAPIKRTLVAQRGTHFCAKCQRR